MFWLTTFHPFLVIVLAIVCGIIVLPAELLSERLKCTLNDAMFCVYGPLCALVFSALLIAFCAFVIVGFGESNLEVSEAIALMIFGVLLVLFDIMTWRELIKTWKRVLKSGKQKKEDKYLELSKELAK